MNSDTVPSHLARRYSDIKCILELIKIFVLFLFLAAFYLNDWGYLFSGTLQFSWRAAHDGIFLFVFYGLLNAILFPLELLSDYLVEKKYHLSSESFTHWFLDYSKSFLLGGVILLIAGLIFYHLLRSGSSSWYIPLWSIFVVLSGLFTMMVPQAIIPLFFAYRRIEDIQLRDRLLRLAASQGIPLKDIFVIDASSKSKKGNAFICGLGRTRRLVLTDTLLTGFSHDEIEAAVAHEIAHLVQRDSARLFVMNSLAGFFFFFIAAKAAYLVFRADRPLLYDIGSLPFFALIFFMLNLLAFPLGNAYVRQREQAADKLSFSFLRHTSGFVSLMERLCAQNLSEYNPPGWKEFLFFNHPSPARRVQYAKTWKE